MKATKIKALDLPVKEALEPAKFIDPEVYIRIRLAPKAKRPGPLAGARAEISKPGPR